VQPEIPLRVPSIDLTTWPEAEAFAECDRIARIEATRPFNLAFAHLIRVTHVRVRSDIAILLVTAHHAVCDGWSIGLLTREMGAVCAALQAGRRPDLPQLPITYGDYAVWQREVVAGGGLATDMVYWSFSTALSSLRCRPISPANQCKDPRGRSNLACWTGS
jgi:Condensation domain